MPQSIQFTIREVLLAEIEAQTPRNSMSQNLQRGSVLNAARRNLPGHVSDEAILTQWSELFRTGLLAWGLNLNNPDPPHFHVTDRGQQALEHFARDPANPAGYLRHLESIAKLDAVAKSYLQEGLDCYVDGLFRASAVMVGCAAERIILTLRDETLLKIQQLGRKTPKGMDDWRIRTVADALHGFFEGQKTNFDRGLREPFEAYWSAFSQQIRATRNDAGHPSSIEPVTPDTVHASLLVFPELHRLANGLSDWVGHSLN